MRTSELKQSNRRKRPGISAFSFLRSKDSNNSEEEEESKTFTNESEDANPFFPTLERAIQLHYLAQNVRRGFHAGYHGQHAFIPPMNDQRRGTTFLATFIPFVRTTIYCTMMMIFIMISSIFLYVVLYNLVMPSNALTRDVFFDYTSNGNNILRPKAEIELMSTHTQWTAYVDDIVDPMYRTEDFNPSVASDEKPRILQPRQSYYIHLALTLPESSINRNIGMFMVNMKLYHSASCTSIYRGHHHLDNQQEYPPDRDLLLATSSRPAMLPFQSTYVSTVQKSAIMIPLIIGAIPEARTIIVESFDHFVESFKYPITKVQIEVVSTSQNEVPYEKPIQVHKAELRIGMELNWFQRLLKEWFYTCAMVGCFVFASGQVMGWSLVKLLYRIKTKANRLRRGQFEDVCFDDEQDSSYLDLSENVVLDEDGNDDYDDDDDDSEQWDPISPEDDENQSIETQHYSHDFQQHAVVGESHVVENIQDDHVPSPQHTMNGNKKSLRRNRKKKKKSSSNTSGSIPDEEKIKEKKNDGMQEIVNRVMQGDVGPYEIFTDLDEPS